LFTFLKKVGFSPCFYTNDFDLTLANILGSDLSAKTADGDAKLGGLSKYHQEVTDE
jgi:hypothetical protein